VRAAIAVLALVFAACAADEQPAEDAHAPVETWEYEFFTHADCNGERDVVLTMCFPAGPGDLVEPGDAAAQAYADLWLAACDVDHGVLGGVGPSHPGYCASATGDGESVWGCSISFGPDFRACAGGGA
jgi:hypothetical protein